MTTPNLAAFLAMIAHSEGSDNVRDGNGLLVDAYRVCYAKRHVIHDLAYHPAEIRPDGTREWGGERITRGEFAGRISTAAGRLQITVTTWRNCKSVLQLHNFGPDAQDDVGVLLIKQAGALMLVNNGQVSDAIARCHPIWASLPGSTAGQPITPIASLMKAYADAGGSAYA